LRENPKDYRFGCDTPADRAGIKVEGDNKWITIIQNTSRKAKA